MGLLSAARPRTSGNLSSVRNIRQYSGVGAGGGGGRGWGGGWLSLIVTHRTGWPRLEKKC